MRILILGGAGMLGHQLWRRLKSNHEVWVTLRKPVAHYGRFGLFECNRALSGVDVGNSDALEHAFGAARPEVVINCIGIIKQHKDATNPLASLAINSLLPHRLAQLCSVAGARLVHISTDCVFSGRKGDYTEEDVSDAEDLYGRSKFLGEIHYPHCLTLRTSIIGRELETHSGLLEWFLSQQGRTIKGYRKAIYTGFTTHELARLVEQVLLLHPQMSGLWHVSSNAINKYDLLNLFQQVFDWRGKIEPDDNFLCNRSLNSRRFREHIGYSPPSWPEMLAVLAETS